MQNKYISYFRYYRDEDISSDFAWWYCLSDDKIYNTEDLYKLFGYSTKDGIYATCNYVEFEKVDIIELKKRYLHQILSNREYKKFNNLADKEFDIKFNQYIDIYNRMSDWHEFEEKILSEALLKWSSAHGISHILLK